MKALCRQIAAGVLTLAVALTGTVPAVADPPTAPNQGCLGQTFHVSIERHTFTSTGMTVAGGQSASGSRVIAGVDLSIKATYVQELRDGKVHRASGSVDWSGQTSDLVAGCGSSTCNAGGHLDLGPSDVHLDDLKKDQQDVMKWSCTGKITGNCFNTAAFLVNVNGPYTAKLPYPDIRKTLEQLRYAHGSNEGFYSEVAPDGTRYSETVESRGNETLSISADPIQIDPNASCKDSSCDDTKPGEATSQLTITATCDGVPLKDRQIGVRVDVMSYSGGHNHVNANEPRPRGSLVVGQTEVDCGKGSMDALGYAPRLDLYDTPCVPVRTDPNGVAKVKFKSPLTGPPLLATKEPTGPYRSGIAGSYWITARDVQITAAPVTTMILAQAKDGKGNPFKRVIFNKYLTGLGDTSSHPENLYGSQETLDAFGKLAERFGEYQDLHNKALTGQYCHKDAWPPVKLSLNDVALPDGGIFDLSSDWGPSHYTHSKGGGGDFNRFGEFLDKNGIGKTGIECGGTTAELQVWYLQVLVELGKDFGQWDCKDLKASSEPVITKQGCQDGDIPIGVTKFDLPGPSYPGPSFMYLPPLLHLHVED